MDIISQCTIDLTSAPLLAVLASPDPAFPAVGVTSRLLDVPPVLRDSILLIITGFGEVIEGDILTFGEEFDLR